MTQIHAHRATWPTITTHLGFFGFWSMVVFLIILTIGFLYEWQKGSLNWS
ncbi:MAG: NADH-quinone oxidoreductase subunit A [Myxococcota bacterium]